MPAAEARSVFGDLKREGGWLVPAESHWTTVFGDIVLDLRGAQTPGGRITIDVHSVFGDVDLLVPEGVAVEVQARTFLGDVGQKAGLAAPPGAPVVVLTGYTAIGDVKVRAERLSERLLARWRGR